VTLSGVGVGTLGTSSKGGTVAYRRTRARKAPVTERRKLTIDADLGISADGGGPTVGASLKLSKRLRVLRRGGLAAEEAALTNERGTGSTESGLERLAKGSRSSSGNGSDASRMTSWQRLPPSLHLIATDESLARRPFIRHTGEAVVSPPSVLSEESEDGEQSNDGNDGLVGDAVNVSDTDT
jgi:hypothetical protein